MPLDQPVDVFSAVERAGLWLMFQPCDGIKGALCQDSGATGVLINSNHPLSLQRFTAAHELGHYRLGHREAVDLTGDDNQTCQLDGIELEAESFASYFLMQERAVKRVLPSAGPISPTDAYQAALRLQVSYAAMVTRLQDLRLVSFTQAQTLRAVAPKTIKQSITHGLTGELGRRQVWMVRAQDPSRVLTPLEGDEVHVLLPEKPSSGFSWREAADADAPIHRIADDAHFDGESFGGSTERHLAYLVDRPSAGTLALSHARGWEAQELESFGLRIEPAENRSGAEGRGLPSSQLQLLAARSK